ncbi:MAG: DUF4810 domain-containing protein [Thermodesulfobacteriota bacterium]
MKRIKVWLVVFGLLVIVGCAPQTKYYWGGYDNKLYHHYKNPADYEKLVENLAELINQAEKVDKVPPGLYAEYGFALYEKGDLEESQIYFKKEHDKWPESQALMTKMISNAQRQSNKSAQLKDTSNEKPLALVKEVTQ